MKDKQFCFVYITVQNFEEAKLIAELAISSKLCACANILPTIHSMFKWKGKINLEKETVLILKTISEKFDELEKLVIKNHSYDTPCILKIDISRGNREFLNWVEGEVKQNEF